MSLLDSIFLPCFKHSIIVRVLVLQHANQALEAHTCIDNVESRIRKTVPESSVVGMLLQSNAKVIVVKADAVGIMQHMGNSWQVAENGDFERENELTVTAQLIKRTLDDWLDTVGQKQRERAIDQIYEIFAAAGYGNIADLMANWTDSLPKIVAAARGTDRETRELIKAVVKAIPASAARVVREG